MLGVASTQLIGVAAQLTIADLLSDGPKPVALLAKRTSTREQALLQVLGALVALGIFTEIRPGVFANAPLGELLRTDVPNSLKDYAIMLASGMMMRGWANLLHALRTTEGALDDALGMETCTCISSRTPQTLLCSTRRCPQSHDKKPQRFEMRMTFPNFIHWSM